MSTHAYSEDQLVEQPAIGLFATLGWQTVSALDESFGAGSTLGRETRGEAVLVERLRAALCKFNLALPPEAISNAVDELTRDRSAMSLEAANREVYALLKEGIAVSVPDREHGGQKTERLCVVDWEHPENNDFLLVSQFSVVGSLYTCRPDLVGFVNGLPWVVIELKKPGVLGGPPSTRTLPTTSNRFRRCSGVTRCSSPAMAPTVASARSPPTGAAGSSGSASSARTNRAACRWK